MHLRKAAAVLFILLFTAAMFHFFYGEGHCPVRLLSAAGAFDQVHHHHGDASTCLSFSIGLFGPETCDWDGAAVLQAALPPPRESRMFSSLGTDISRPPNSLLAC